MWQSERSSKQGTRRLTVVVVVVLSLPVVGMIARLLGKLARGVAIASDHEPGQSLSMSDAKTDVVQALGGVLALGLAVGAVFLAVAVLRKRDRARARESRESSTNE